ncbi:Uma2 family endonuclease [Actinoplanes sp. NPDC048988]|uniref:Uma2 family endonuclease n=1 Tax=Actinoplanes sp. NPDC048988 TaxID=3363901 RepID=UPI00371225C4
MRRRPEHLRELRRQRRGHGRHRRLISHPGNGAWSLRRPAPFQVSSLPGSSYSLVVEVVSERSPNGEYTEKAAWYAEQGIPEYWIVDQAEGRPDDDGLVRIHRLTLTGDVPAYIRERNVLLSELESEYRTR